MLIDSHCHLKNKRYGKTVEEIIEEAKEENVVKFINIGTNFNDNIISIELGKQFAEVYSSIGIYPNEEQGKTHEEILNHLKTLLDTEKDNIIAIGECGFDLTEWNNQRPLGKQREIFETQVELAIKHELPLIIHNRNADEELLKTLNNYKNSNLCSIIHCFSSTWEFAKKALDLGSYISFSGMITYPARHELTETVIKAPEDKILVETDAPYLPPQEKRGQVNHPKNVKIVAQEVAELRKTSLEQIENITYDNTCRVFNL